MKNLLPLLFLPLGLLAQPKGLVDELYEEYEPKPYVSGFSFGGSFLSALPLDIEIGEGTLERTLQGEIDRIQWLKISDDRYLEEVTRDWARFLDRAGYKKIKIDDEDGDENFIYIRGTRTRFDEAHFLLTEDDHTFLLTAYGDFTLIKTLHED